MEEPSYQAVAKPEPEQLSAKRDIKNRRGLFCGLGVGITILAGVVTWTHRNSSMGANNIPFVAKHRDAQLKGSAAGWVPFESREHPDSPTAIWGKISRPYPTGAWFTNLVVGGPNNLGVGLGGAMVTPYAVTVTPKEGYGLSCGAMNVANESITIGTSTELAVTAAEGGKRRHIEKADDMTMTMRLETSHLRQEGFVDAIFARGSPYVTFEFSDCTPMLASPAMSTVTDAEAPEIVPFGDPDFAPADDDEDQSCELRPSCTLAALHGHCCPLPSGDYHPCCDDPRNTQGPSQTFNIKLLSGGHWRVWTNKPITLKWTTSEAVATESVEDLVMRVAFVPDGGEGGDTDLLDAHVGTYPVASSVALYRGAKKGGVVEFDWAVRHMSSTKKPVDLLLMLALPHHTATMDSAIVDQKKGLEYRGGLLGLMKPIVGTKWTMKYTLTEVGWSHARPDVLTDAEIAVLKTQLEVDVTPPQGASEADVKRITERGNEHENAYWNGKEMAKYARLALIGESLGDEASTQKAKRMMINVLEEWLDQTNGDPLVYDATYGGLCTTRGLYDHDADFGNGYYNDHHFHYGYILYAAAVAVKFDPGFASKYRSQLLAIAYDFAGPGAEDSGLASTVEGMDASAFPRARHKDFYEGHSWASGIFFMGQGKAQESSSEAVNAYYSAYLLAKALGDDAFADWNRILLATELQTAQLYYHMTLHGKNQTEWIYPNQFAKRRMVGVLGALSTGSTTWFGPSPALSHGIQILPVTPITEDLFDDHDFVRDDIAYLDKLLKDEEEVSDAWKAFIECERAVVDPEKAWDNLNKLSEVDDGTTKTALLYWIATRPKLDKK